MFLVINGVRGEIIDIVDQAVMVENGIDVGDMIYGDPCLELVQVESVPSGVVPRKYVYKNSAFSINPYHVEPTTQFTELTDRISVLETLVLQLGGVI